MKSMIALALAVVASTATVSAQPVRWTRYTIPQTGTAVDLPSSIFTEEAGRPDGYGQRFRTGDGRADITIQAAPNMANDSLSCCRFDGHRVKLIPPCARTQQG
ncbi:hypothetical protein Bra1253DRAFT_00025 [Bradyrhizobium sp. WSM1253]|nr:hypothetical protein Bra1253DRAFT_00025 [Bradyrhizobium sp. WSM1253]